MSGRKRFKGSRVRPAVYIHVGAPKTGTTFLQKVLWRGSRRMGRDGVLYPAEPTGDHFRAAQDLRGVRFRDYDDPEVPGSWQRVVDLACKWTGRAVVISHEHFAWASHEQARAAVESLRPADVHVIYTVRDLARQLPAMWQEDVKNGGVADFLSFLRAVQTPDGPDPHGGSFWESQDAVAVLDRWGAAVSPDRIHVVTVPPPGAQRDLLWRRFAALIGLDPDSYDTGVGRPNVSLGRTDTELLRCINRALDGRLQWPQYELLVKHWLAENILAARPTDERVSLPPKWYAWAIERSEQLAEGLLGKGYDVVGDLRELIPAVNESEGADDPPEDAVASGELEARARGIADLLERIALTPSAEWPQPGRLRRLEEDFAARQAHPIKGILRDVSDRNRAVQRVRVAWWHTVERARGVRSRLARRTGTA